jgi:hypothetical protein
MLPWFGLSVKLVVVVALAVFSAIYGPDQLDCPKTVAQTELTVHWPWCESTKVSHLPSDEGVPHESKQVPKGQEAKAL